MPGKAIRPGLHVIAKRCRAALRADYLTVICSGEIALAALVPAGARSAMPPKAAAHAMQALQDDELAAVRGADGIAFNLNNFSLTSSLTNPLTDRRASCRERVWRYV